uniref:Alpha-mannosidase n=1 Tax=Panagrolaimus sp. JU765 TaxID=591449 RepID=A0AC34Q5P7_9BILA
MTPRFRFAIFIFSAVVFLLLVFYSQDLVSGSSLVQQALPFRRSLLTNKLAFKDVANTGEKTESFENYDVMIKGSKIQYNSKSKWTNGQKISTKDLLSIHVVMHSHVDPGWLETFEEYYNDKVHSILNLTVKHLNENPDMRFIWSEMSFLERWWRDATEEQKTQAKKLVKDGQLELSGGAWVMTDEATPYFWGTIDNMVEGHYFVKQTFGRLPKTSWSVDPFGHGMMVPYLLAESGITSMVIGRLNAHLKAELREKQMLMFYWAQIWDKSGRMATPLVDALPKTYYTTSDACGPDSNVCCQFDLGPSARSYCSKRASNIDNSNIDDFATQLAGQYRKVSDYYPTNVILVPVGDDFFYSKDADWTITHNSYKKLFDYINGNPEKYKMRVQFSTVEEYFKKVQESKADFPTFTGDFFPYTEDKTGRFPYWTGFYAHRPFFKRSERLTEGKLRATDLLSTLSHYSEIVKNVRPARRDLSLCQHHDSITGTSKPKVMDDYLQRLQNAFLSFNTGIQEIISKRIAPTTDSFSLMVFPQNSSDGKTNLHLVTFTAETKAHQLLVFNQGTQKTMQKITLRVNDPRIQVLENDFEIAAQILPVMDFSSGSLSEAVYELVFFIPMNPLELKNLRLIWQQKQPKSTILSMVFSVGLKSPIFTMMPLNDSNKFSLSNSLFSVQFVDGLIASVRKSGDNASMALQVTYKSYVDNGGAYTFVNRGPASNMHKGQLPSQSFTPFYIVGPLTSKSITRTSASLFQTAIVDNGNSISDFAVHLELFSNQGDMDITQIMEVKTNIVSHDEFYTDINGLYFLKRSFDTNVLFEGNFYPVASSLFIEDQYSRLTVLTGQPTGATVNKNSMEIMLDRRISGEDGKGLGAGDASYSPPSLLKYDLVLENKRPTAVSEKSNDSFSIFFSSIAYFTLQNLLYPPEMSILRQPNQNIDTWGNFDWPCNIELINARYLDENTGLILLRRLPFDTTLSQLDCFEDDLKSLYTALSKLSKQTPLILTSLTGTIDQSVVVDESNLKDILKMPLKLVALKFGIK